MDTVNEKIDADLAGFAAFPFELTRVPMLKHSLYQANAGW